MLPFTRRYEDNLRRRDWWFWCHFVHNVLGYKSANNYTNIERFDKVVAKIKRCSFLASHSVDCWNGIFIGCMLSRCPTNSAKALKQHSPCFGMQHNPWRSGALKSKFHETDLSATCHDTTRLVCRPFSASRERLGLLKFRIIILYVDNNCQHSE